MPYERQAFIYYSCLDYKNQEEDIKAKIDVLCDRTAGNSDYDRKALFELLTNKHMTAAGIAQKYYINEKKLYKLRREFFESW